MRTDLRFARFATGLLTAALAAFAAFSAGSGRAQAAEMFAVPEGVVVRTLFNWDATNALDVILGDQTVHAAYHDGEGDDTLTPEQICENAAYRAGVEQADGSASGSLVSLGGLCTHADDEQLTFAFISDTQQYHAEHEKVAKVLNGLLKQNLGIRFVLNGGDLVQQSDDNEWQQYRAIATKYYSSLVPLVPVVGNHDTRGDATLSRFNHVYGAPSVRAHYYALDFGPAVLLVLDSNTDALSAADVAAETGWLASTLAQYSGTKPILVTYHHPAYSSGVAHIWIPGPPKYVQEQWLPLFQRYGVRLVLNGHEHVYERLNVDGLQHLLAGPAGGKMGLVSPFHSTYSQKLLPNTRTVSVVTVKKTGATSIRTYESERGALVDSLEY